MGDTRSHAYARLGALMRSEPDPSPAGASESIELAQELGLPVAASLAGLWREVEGERSVRLFPLLRICRALRPSDDPELPGHLRVLDNMRLHAPTASLDAREAGLEYGVPPGQDPMWVPLATDNGGNELFLAGDALIAWRKDVFDEPELEHALRLCADFAVWLAEAEQALEQGSVRWELDAYGEGRLVHAAGLIYDDVAWREDASDEGIHSRA